VAQVTQMAKPLPKQDHIDKGRVWLVFIGGAASLFVGTVLVENNAAWFPAISRANAAMAQTKKRSQQVRVLCVLCVCAVCVCAFRLCLVCARVEVCMPVAHSTDCVRQRCHTAVLDAQCVSAPATQRHKHS
jgi:hypothetical protein